MKVLHYTPKFSVISETFIYDQISEIEKLSISSLVLCDIRINAMERPCEYVECLSLKNLISYKITQKLAFGKGFELLKYFIDYTGWLKKLTEYQPDIIHCHTGNAAKTWFHIANKLKSNVPALISLHGSDVTMEPHLKNSYKQVLQTLAKKNNVYWTVPSLFLKEKAMHVFDISAEKVFVVNNGVNPIFKVENRHVSLALKTHFNILSVGRFITCKGQEYLIKAFGLILKSNPNCLLTLVGDGPKKEECVDLAKSLGIYEKIRFISSLSHQDVVRLMYDSDLYVQPSIKDPITLQEESFGVAALEAISTGLPVVVGDCGGLPEVIVDIPNKYGKVVPQQSVDELHNEMLVLIEQNEKIPPEILKEVHQRFSMTQNASSIISIYEKLQLTC